MKVRYVFAIGAIVLCGALSVALSAGRAANDDGMTQQHGPDPLAESFFPPELILQHQLEIGLNEEQKVFFKSEGRKAQTRFTELQWTLQDEMEKLQALIKSPRVDEVQTLAQLDKLLDVERNIKRTQIGLLVRFKNQLTPEQQAQLRGFKFKK